MRKQVVAVALVGFGAAVAVWPDVRAYRRLAAISRSLRADAAGYDDGAPDGCRRVST